MSMYVIIYFQIIYSVSKSHSSYSNCDSEQLILYTDLHIMDDFIVAIEAIQ